FVRESLARKLWRRERFTREELVLTIYGVLALAYTAFFLYKGIHFWNATFADFLTDLVGGGNWIMFGLALLFAALMLVPLILVLLRQVHQAAGLASRGARVVLRLARPAA